MTSPLERALVTALPWLIVGAVLAPFGLLLGDAGTSPTFRLVTHLAVLVMVGLVLADRLAALLRGDGWFAGAGWSGLRRRFAAAVVLVVIPTGVVALITLASAAALRFDPSLQFLQLLSALDIVWAGAALYYGVWLIWGTAAARIAAALLGLVCVWSLANYVRVVGFTEAGGWLVDGSKLMTLVIPFDMVAAGTAIVFLTIGLRRSEASGAEAAQPTEQASDQSYG